MLPHGSRTEIINDISSGVDGIVWVVHSLGVGVVSCLANEAILPSKNSRAAEWWAYSFVSRNAGREVAPPARIRF